MPVCDEVYVYNVFNSLMPVCDEVYVYNVFNSLMPVCDEVYEKLSSFGITTEQLIVDHLQQLTSTKVCMPLTFFRV